MQQFQATSTPSGAPSAARRQSNYLPDEIRAAIVAEIRKGRPHKEIADQFGIAAPTVSKIGIKAGLRRCAKFSALTAGQQAEIASRYAAGESSMAIAALFGISDTTVRDTLHRIGAPVRGPARVQRPIRHDALDVLTPDAAYWCGIMFTDGTVNVRKSGQPEFALVLKRSDQGHLEKLRDFLGSTHAITPCAPTSIPASVARPNGAQGTGTFRFSVRSQPLCDRLLALGRYGPAVHPALAASRDFWRGCIDGDGTVAIYSGVPCLKLFGSHWLLSAFVDFLGPVGSNRPLRVRPSRTIYQVGTSGGGAGKIIERLYTGASTALDRKAEAAAAIIRNGPRKTPTRKAS